MLHVDDSMWQRDGKGLSSSGRYDIRKEDAFGKHGMNLYLRITNVTKNDEGLYTCLGLKNGITANKTFYLKTGLLNSIDLKYYK